MPLVVGWVALFPAIVAAVVWGQSSGQPAAALPRPNDPFWFPLTHLWFLYVLVWLYAATLLARSAFECVIDRSGRIRRRLDAAMRTVVDGWWGVVVLAAPLAIALVSQPMWIAWAGVPTPDQSLVPNTPAMVAFGTAFGFGWLLHRQIALLQVWERRWPVNMALATGLTIACLMLLGGPAASIVPAAAGWQTWLYAACYTIAIWAWTFGILGVALRFCSGEHAVRRYLADASYWIYLLHLPVVFLLQAAMRDLSWHWTAKFPIILLAALGILFVSYHHLVRPRSSAKC